MEDFKGNSYKAKDNQEKNTDKQIKKVVTGQAKVKKKSDFQRFAELFVPEDVGSVKDYIIMDVIVPSAKKAISDVITTGIDMMLYGEAGAPRSRNSSRESRVSYGSYYSRKGDTIPDSSRSRTGYSYDEIILESRIEAEDVLGSVNELIDVYGMASVADLYDLVGVTGNYTDVNYGWINIRNASVVRVKDGYMLKMPKPLPLK